MGYLILLRPIFPISNAVQTRITTVGMFEAARHQMSRSVMQANEKHLLLLLLKRKQNKSSKSKMINFDTCSTAAADDDDDDDDDDDNDDNDDNDDVDDDDDDDDDELLSQILTLTRYKLRNTYKLLRCRCERLVGTCAR